MKKTINTDWPIISALDLMDERKDSVHILFVEGDQKTTAEDCGDWWRLVHWKKYLINDFPHWFDVNRAEIEKNIVVALHALDLMDGDRHED